MEIETSGVQINNRGVNQYCMLCGTQGDILYQNLRDRLFDAPGKWSIRRCNNPQCGLLWLDPVPSRKDMEKIYQNYYTHGTGEGEARQSGFRAKLRKVLGGAYGHLVHYSGLTAARQRLFTMYIAELRPGRLLEIGFGNGRFLDCMHRSGWDVEGIDQDAVAVDIVRKRYGFNVHSGTLGDMNYSEGSFDVIAMNHVIEHVHDLLSLLRECRRVLRDEGFLIVITPNISSLGHQIFKENWLGLDPPRHLYLFSPQTLRESVGRAGFQNVNGWTTSVNAEVFALGSLDIKDFGRHRMGEAPRFKQLIKSLIFQYYALPRTFLNRELGEELVLICRK